MKIMKSYEWVYTCQGTNSCDVHDDGKTGKVLALTDSMGIVAAMNLTALLWPGATTVQDKINNQVTLQKMFKVPNEFFQFLQMLFMKWNMNMLKSLPVKAEI